MTRTAGSSTLEGVLVDWVVDHPVEPTRLPAAWLSPAEAAAELQRLQARRARDTAYEADLVLQLAGQRPASADPRPEHPGARRPGWLPEAAEGVSEFFTAELSMVLNVGRGTAAHRLAHALTWRDKLPATYALLRSGELDERRAIVLAQVLEHATADVAGRIEDVLLPLARDLSAWALEKRATALLQELDPVSAAERRKRAAETADVTLRPSQLDGRTQLVADLPTEEALVEYAVINDLAQLAKRVGDKRPIGVIRTEIFAAVRRQLDGSGYANVRVNLTITADLTALEDRSSRPGEVNGLVITAAHLRELLARMGALGLTAPEGGSLSFAITGPAGELLATVTAAELERLVKRGCPDHPDGGTDCGCAVLGSPPETEAYEPTAKQRAFVTTRDRRCRFPNCGQRVGWADLDHVIAHSCGGRTDCTNLCCLCRSHHRLKTFAPGWRFAMTADGMLTVTTPSGVTRTTRPTGMRVRAPDPPPPEPEPEPEPPPAVPDPNDDRPPF
ncbi:DUF222 domain-containing protein [Modestobacter sp. NPDC049651]|uniref:HNH endonuclease signature motif containing protein n=1 Tax=unclassified Modestobacter TaxID=2643866 RepID=UPI0033D74814